MGFLARMVVLGRDNPIGAAPAMTTAVTMAVSADGYQIASVVVMAIASPRAHVMFVVTMRSARRPHPEGAAPSVTATGTVAVTAEINQARPVVIMAVAPARATVIGMVPV